MIEQDDNDKLKIVPFHNVIKIYQQNGIPVFYYKDKPYAKIVETKIKVIGLLQYINKAMDADVDLTEPETVEIKEQLKEKNIGWIDVIIYECLYENPDGQIWVREKTEFETLFKPIDNDEESI